MSEIEKLKLEEDIPVVIANENGLIVHVNHAFEEAFGWKIADLVGQMLTKLIPSGLRDAHNIGLSRFVMTNRPTLLNQPLELKILRGDGTGVSATHFIMAEKGEGKWLLGARITPPR